MFEATLKKHFDITQNAAARRVVPRAVAPAPTELTPGPVAPRPPVQSLGTGQTGRHSCDEHDLSMAALYAFARAHELKVEDNRNLNGNLWVRTDDNDLRVDKALLDWGFQYKPGKGWWR